MGTSCVRLHIRLLGRVNKGFVSAGCDDGRLCKGEDAIPMSRYTPKNLNINVGTNLGKDFGQAEVEGTCCYTDSCY